MMILVLLGLTGTGYVWGGLKVYTAYQHQSAENNLQTNGGIQISWTTDFGPTKSLPSAFYANLADIVKLQYKSSSSQELQVSIEIPGFTQQQTITVHATPTLQTVSLKPPLLPNVLDSLTGGSFRAAQINVKVTDNSGQTRYQSSQSINLLSRYQMIWRDAAGQDHSNLIAAWVTPLDPHIQTLIGQAAQALQQDNTSTPGMIGYRNASNQDVINQVDAIFEAMNKKGQGVKYADTYVPYTRDGDNETSEQVKLPKDVLTDNSGMCIETTLVMASAVENLGMHPYIVIIPGHAFLEVALGPDPNSPREAWETSLLGANYSGETARQFGDNELAQNQQHIITVIDIDAAIQAGIVPME